MLRTKHPWSLDRKTAGGILHAMFLVGVIALGANSTHINCWANDSLDALASAESHSEQASTIVRQLQQDSTVELLDVLGAMQGKTAVAKNWYLSLAQSIADRNPQKSMAELDQFLPRLSEDATARYWAFTYLTRNDPARKELLLESMLADPSLELRYEAVALGLKRMGEDEGLSPQQLTSGYRELLAAARLPEQVQQVAEKLEELDVQVDLLKHFGFVSRWKVIGSFDNVDQRGFEVQYEPEVTYLAGKLDWSKPVQGKSAEVTWEEVATDQDDGSIDLNAVYDNEKGAIVFAYSEFESDSDVECEVRLGSPNACIVWVNGKELIRREVYHSGNQIDQYTSPVKLARGKNSILVKVCQNEQKQPWAQDWSFQLRFADSSGLAVQAAR